MLANIKAGSWKAGGVFMDRYELIDMIRTIDGNIRAENGFVNLSYSGGDGSYYQCLSTALQEAGIQPSDIGDDIIETMMSEERTVCGQALFDYCRGRFSMCTTQG